MNTSVSVGHQRPRGLMRIVKGLPTTDGAGVELTRVIGQPALMMVDPFLMLDAFRSDKPEDYIAGFPAHPHRGFEAVTYLLAGRVRHRDSAGHEGMIEAGDIQWMTAGRGIVHSEIPEQEAGLLEGFQLWVNLPAEHKMDAPGYQEYPAGEIPLESREGGIQVRVLAGTTSRGARGPVVQPLTEPLYLDVRLPAGQTFVEALPTAHNAFVYVIDGILGAIGEDGSEASLRRDDLGVLGDGDVATFTADGRDARFLLVAGRPLGEPVARGGPFVMNTQAEIRRAFEDYEQGRF